MKTLGALLILISVGLSQAVAKAFPAVQSDPHAIFSDLKYTPLPDWTDAGKYVETNVRARDGKIVEKLHRTPYAYERIPNRQHDFEYQYGRSVFVATAGGGIGTGTAFLIAPSLVLTNHHVLGSFTDCRKFSVDVLIRKNEEVKCQQVEYCSHTSDYCIIRMNRLKSGEQLGDVVKPLHLQPVPPFSGQMVYGIGNTHGLGLQAASHFGTQVEGNDIIHCVNLFSGNSGSPLLNEWGEVLGIHDERTPNHTGGLCPFDRDLGHAVRSSVILNSIQFTNPFLYLEITAN